jgi:hypothetical protein
MPFFGAYERRVKKREIPVISLERDLATPDRKRKD